MFNVGNIVYSKTDSKHVMIMGVDSTFRLDGSKRTKYKVYVDSETKYYSENELSGIPLCENTLFKLDLVQHSILSKNDMWYNHYGPVYLIGAVGDASFVIVRDWSKEPSYHVGIVYEDSPFPIDDNQVYTFLYEVKFVHELQNILNVLNNELPVDWNVLLD